MQEPSGAPNPKRRWQRRQDDAHSNGGGHPPPESSVPELGLLFRFSLLYDSKCPMKGGGLDIDNFARKNLEVKSFPKAPSCQIFMYLNHVLMGFGVISGSGRVECKEEPPADAKMTEACGPAVCVIGGGPSGLGCCRRLCDAGMRVTLIQESRGRDPAMQLAEELENAEQRNNVLILLF